MTLLPGSIRLRETDEQNKSGAAGLAETASPSFPFSACPTDA
jgi:hypothetical protein